MNTAEPLYCSYCGADLIDGDPFHAHRYRPGRFIHATCLLEHRHGVPITDDDEYWRSTLELTRAGMTRES